jgi:hypothetical protein
MAKLIIAMGPKMKGKSMKKKMEDEVLLDDLPEMEEEDDFAEEDDMGMDMEDMEELPEDEEEDMGMDMGPMVSEEELSIAGDLMKAIKDDDAEAFSMSLRSFLECCK